LLTAKHQHFVISLKRRSFVAGKHSSRKWKKKGKCRWKTRKKRLKERRRKAKIRVG